VSNDGEIQAECMFYRADGSLRARIDPLGVMWRTDIVPYGAEVEFVLSATSANTGTGTGLGPDLDTEGCPYMPTDVPYSRSLEYTVARVRLDAGNRLVSKTNGQGITEEYWYDAFGRFRGSFDAMETRRMIQRDIRGRIVARLTLDSSAPPGWASAAGDLLDTPGLMNVELRDYANFGRTVNSGSWVRSLEDVMELTSDVTIEVDPKARTRTSTNRLTDGRVFSVTQRGDALGRPISRIATSDGEIVSRVSVNYPTFRSSESTYLGPDGSDIVEKQTHGVSGLRFPPQHGQVDYAAS
jgi:YD repeat-containing protein